MKIVLNKCYGGFGLSKKAVNLYNKKAGTSFKDCYEIEGRLDKIKFRTNKILVEVVEELGSKANDAYSDLRVLEVPDDIDNPHIDDYDGIETLEEGRSW